MTFDLWLTAVLIPVLRMTASHKWRIRTCVSTPAAGGGKHSGENSQAESPVSHDRCQQSLPKLGGLLHRFGTSRNGSEPPLSPPRHCFPARQSHEPLMTGFPLAPAEASTNEQGCNYRAGSAHGRRLALVGANLELFVWKICEVSDSR